MEPIQAFGGETDGDTQDVRVFLEAEIVGKL